MELRFSFTSGIFSGKLNFSRFNLPLFLHPASLGSFCFSGFCWLYPCGPQGLFGCCRVAATSGHSLFELLFGFTSGFFR
ncbi:hypothetical protein D0Y50_13480 [Salinimonas sediminis]|uniref:Uncharacterized protein n=2 Tax=Salinimonas sediminis TaxID=2303538 RepID=A0A346NP07_9ALTE|nr:hypothetical protein D0Y50_13480 [Salinimonas sediminis]